jgi:hypothetical protein
MRIGIRLNDEESKAFKTKLELSNQSISEFVRRALKSSTVKTKFNTEELKLLRTTYGMANNLNQLAKRANEREDLMLLYIEISKTLKEVNLFLEKFKFI